MRSSSHSNTPGSTNARGGNIVARSSGSRVASTSRRSRSSAVGGGFLTLASLGRRRVRREFVDLVVNRMLVCGADGGQVDRGGAGAARHPSARVGATSRRPPATRAALRRGRADAVGGGGRAP